MIAFFPNFYPDELLYSVLARYYVHSGYTTYISVADDLYIKRTTRPDVEFLNHFNPDAFNVLTKNITIEDIILHHTMFPYYSRFLTKERRIKAFNAMINMEGNHHNLLSIPKSEEKRFLRYCPLCVNEDREKYNEAYWHRTHQLMRVNICPKHKCKLLNSNVAINSDFTPSLLSCELSVKPLNVIAFSDNLLECRIAEYVSKVFLSNIDMNSDIEIGDFLHSELSFTKYKSVCGKKIYTSLLYEDIKEKFKSLPDSFTQKPQIEKILSSYRTNTYEVCLIAFFLNIPPKRLTHLSLPEKSQKELFEEKILKLKNQGFNYRQISKQLNASYDYIKLKGKNL